MTDLLKFLQSAPEAFRQEHIRAYAKWCRLQPAAFPSDEPTPPVDIAWPQDIREYLLAFRGFRERRRFAEGELASALLTDSGDVLLWCLFQTQTARGRALYEVLPALAPLEGVRRGGINVYKRLNWTLHVLVVSQMLWSDLPRGQLPPSLNWADDARQEMRTLVDCYSKLSHWEVRLLRTACLIHDIGVRDGVPDHDKKGIKYVEEALRTSGVSDLPSLVEAPLSAQELLAALRAMVGEHTLASKVNAESGDAHIRASLRRAADSARGSPALERFFEESFPRLLSLFLVCDIVGVADELLTPATIRRAKEAVPVLQRLAGPESLPVPSAERGLDRIAVIVGEESPSNLWPVVNELLGERPNGVLEALAAADRLSYGMGVLKPLERPEMGCRILLSLAASHAPIGRGWALDFSPHCSLKVLQAWSASLCGPVSLHPAPRAFGVEIEIGMETSITVVKVRTANEQA